MPISVTCACGKKLRVKDELAGRRGKCPVCGATLTIPQPAKPPEPEFPDLAPLAAELYKPVEPLSQQAPAMKPATTPSPLPQPSKSDPYLCPRCGEPMQKTLTAKSLLSNIALGMTAGFYFVPQAPFRCARCGPIQYQELSREESRRAQEVVSTKGCLKVIGYSVLAFVLLMVLAFMMMLLEKMK